MTIHNHLYTTICTPLPHQEEAAAQEEAAHASKRHRTSDIPEQEDLFGEDDDDDADAPQAAPPIDQEYDGEGQATEADRAFIDDTGICFCDVFGYHIIWGYYHRVHSLFVVHGDVGHTCL